MKKITVIIPCHNEEKGLAKVLRAFPKVRLRRLGYILDVIVVDNGSTDRTATIARRFKARVIYESVLGKGNALKTGFHAVPQNTDYVVMLDGDGTYNPAEIIRMVEPLESRFAHAVVGSRLGGKTNEGSITFKHRVVNWAFAFLVRVFYVTNVTDVLSGYFAWKRDVVRVLAPHLTSPGFAIEMEMITKMVRLGFDVYSVPITYDKREGRSKIEAIRDGLKILRMFLANLSWHPTRKLRKQANLIVSL